MKFGKAGRVKGEAAEGVGSPTSNTVDDHRDLESPKGWATEGSHGVQRQEGYVMGNPCLGTREECRRSGSSWTGLAAGPGAGSRGAWSQGAGVRLQKPVSLPQCRSASRRQP